MLIAASTCRDPPARHKKGSILGKCENVFSVAQVFDTMPQLTI